MSLGLTAMEVELFCICDAATDYNGRLNILGVFEGFAAAEAPVLRDRCSIAMRFRFEVAENGLHAVGVRIADASGSELIPEMKARMSVKTGPGRSSVACNLVLNLNGVRFPTFGDYSVRLRVDDQERAALPLAVAQLKRGGRGPAVSEN